MPLRSSSLRSLGGYGNVFAIESFMDECAAAAWRRPGGVSLEPPAGPARPGGDRKAAAECALRPQDRGPRPRHRVREVQESRGVLRGGSLKSKSTHEVRVTRLVAAVDVGLPVNPDGVVNQIEGGCIQAASWTLKEA